MLDWCKGEYMRKKKKKTGKYSLKVWHQISQQNRKCKSEMLRVGLTNALDKITHLWKLGEEPMGVITEEINTQQQASTLEGNRSLKSHKSRVWTLQKCLFPTKVYHNFFWYAFYLFIYFFHVTKIMNLWIELFYFTLFCFISFLLFIVLLCFSHGKQTQNLP